MTWAQDMKVAVSRDLATALQAGQKYQTYLKNKIKFKKNLKWGSLSLSIPNIPNTQTFFCFKEKGFIMLPSLVLNSWAQAILPFQSSEKLGLQVHATVPS